MPTDLEAPARKRAAHTMLLFWVIVCFGILGVLLKVFGQYS
jgi:hypothetical protein